MSEPGDAPSVPSAADAEVARLRAEAEAAEAELRLARARADLAAAEAAAAAARARAAGGATTADGGDVAALAEGPAQAGGPAVTASEQSSPAASDSPVTADDSAAGAADGAGAEPATPEAAAAPASSASSSPASAVSTPAASDAPLTDAQVAKIAAGYAADGAALDLGVLMNGGPVASVPVRIPLAMTNRHGLVAGATGTGKTRTLQLLAEQLSENGVPVFAADIKGDLSGLAAAGTPSDKLAARTAALGQQWSARAFPTEFYALGDDVGSGIPVRATVSGFGPLLLSRVLGLNATQESSLGLVFHYADEKGLALVDLSDLRAVLTYLTGDEGKAELKGIGGLSAATAGVILRELVAFSAAGADTFFGEPELDVSVFLRTDAAGAGIVSLLEVPNVAARPELYSTFLMYLLAELYEVLPEVGDLDKPKLVFFFDEAHLLFRDASKAFLEAITQTVRLIRSKGVGVFFVTQTPKDVPGDVLAQLGSRVQHALRAFTPDDAKALRASVRTYPDSGYDLERVLQELGTGEAIITVMSERGAPTPVAWTRLFAPRASMSPITADAMASAVSASALFPMYATPIDRESAREILGARIQAATDAREADERAKKAAADAAEYAKQKAAIDKANAEAQKKAQREYERILKSTAAPRSRTSTPAPGLDGLLGRGATKSIVNGVIRGLFGNSRRR
ncbi:helicase HerA-like domain-containing protein [Microbacterium sp. KSW2-29]|uniref:Helicase HerA-like domain-containing protein n=1 Tax=Microbacterium phycohabitans TaxID=3075993 RepID=A0ABU3SNM3_9MICO|nr:helicase HerA-like domain-containing protein [Microbacterium sp. KSW2-29]MDU0346315.1 helicase HerA-like domain-containing protein [Microbacterium sp. KSW2-29]